MAMTIRTDPSEAEAVQEIEKTGQEAAQGRIPDQDQVKADQDPEGTDRQTDKADAEAGVILSAVMQTGMTDLQDKEAEDLRAAKDPKAADREPVQDGDPITAEMTDPMTTEIRVSVLIRKTRVLQEKI